MTGFQFSNGGRRCIRPILETYQSGNEYYFNEFVRFTLSPNYITIVTLINIMFGIITNLVLLAFIVIGESQGYTVNSKEKDFPISDYPLLQTEFLYVSKQGKAHFLNQLNVN